jgi:hypothetical protein
MHSVPNSICGYVFPGQRANEIDTSEFMIRQSQAIYDEKEKKKVKSKGTGNRKYIPTFEKSHTEVKVKEEKKKRKFANAFKQAPKGKKKFWKKGKDFI